MDEGSARAPVSSPMLSGVSNSVQRCFPLRCMSCSQVAASAPSAPAGKPATKSLKSRTDTNTEVTAETGNESMSRPTSKANSQAKSPTKSKIGTFRRLWHF